MPLRCDALHHFTMLPRHARKTCRKERCQHTRKERHAIYVIHAAYHAIVVILRRHFIIHHVTIIVITCHAMLRVPRLRCRRDAALITFSRYYAMSSPPDTTTSSL